MSIDSPSSTGSVTTSPLLEIGQSGLRAYGGIVTESRNSEFNGRAWIDTLTTMWLNDPVIGAVYNAMQLLIRQVEWTTRPANGSRKATKNADFVQQCLDDTTQTWETVIGNILTMVIYGWSYFEIVYKYRNGYQRSTSARPSSRYDDGRIGWRKFAIRSQDTLMRWELDDHGGVRGLWQSAPNSMTPVFIPIEKALLFRLSQYKDNPQGTSLLRNCYRPWFFKRNIEQIEAMGVERDLGGLAVLEMPLRMMQEDSSDSDKIVVQQMRDLVTSVKRDTTEGLILPQDVDRYGHKLFDFRLVASPGNRQFDTSAIVNRYNQLIATSMLADFMLLGQGKTGSYALASTKSNLFLSALEAINESIADVMNQYAIPRLMALNGITADLPELVHGKVRELDLQVISEYIQRLSGSGLNLFPSTTLEDWLLTEAGMPIPTAEERAEARARSAATNPAPPTAMPGDGGGSSSTPPRTDRAPEPNRSRNA